eukprot:gene6890-7668_t
MGPKVGTEEDSIKNYEVLEMLGKGGFAYVYRAYDKRTQQEVGIKVIDKKALQRNDMAARVRNEVEIHCQLKHPSILQLQSYFEDSDHVYLVLELCHNGDLQRFLKNSGKPMNENEARKILLQVLLGVLYLHSHGILHRDLTMGNLLLTKDMKVKISDFGLAAKLKLPTEKHYTMCGTPNFISPEIATRSPHGLESDVWSLGCLLYAILVGKPPFDTEAVRSTLSKVVLADYEIPKSLSPEAKDLIRQLLKKNPDERITLAGILDHPFMEAKHPSSYEDKLMNYSFDSGNVTMGTETTSSDTRSTAKHCRRPPSLNVLEGIGEKEDEYVSNCMKHPPSPPVRLRSSQLHGKSLRKSREDESSCFVTAYNDRKTIGQPSPNAETGCCDMREQGNSFCNNRSSGRSRDSSQCGNQQPGHVGVNTDCSLHSQRCSYTMTQCSNCTEQRSSIVRACAEECRNVNGSCGGVREAGQKTFGSSVEDKQSRISSDGVLRERNRSQEHVLGGLSDGVGSYRPTDTRHLSDGTLFEKTSGVRPSRVSEGKENCTPESINAANVDTVMNTVSSTHTRDLALTSRKPQKSSLEDVMKPLNVQRLRPIRQKTRNVVVSILEDETVCLEFIKARGSDDVRVMEVFKVTSDGIKITTYQPNGKQGTPLAPTAGVTPSSAVSYAFSGLPQRLWKKYQYADRFVRLVRMKTPKITLYSKEAKCVMMENSPDPDFEASFYQGTKVFISSSSKSRVISSSGKSYEIASLKDQSVPHQLHHMLQHAKECLERCKQLEDCIDSLPCDKQALFPLTVSRRPSAQLPLSKAALIESSRDYQKSPMSPPICGPSSVSVMSYDGTVMSESKSKPRSVSSSSASRHSQTPFRGGDATKENHVRPGSLLPNKIAIAPPSATGQLGSSNSTTTSCMDGRVDVDRKSQSQLPQKNIFVPDIGWASQYENGEVRIQFNDGSLLKLQKGLQFISFADHTGQATRYSRTDKFPLALKKKLAQVPATIEKLASTS